MTLASRLWLNIAITTVAAAALLAAHAVYGAALYDPAFLSGWLLLVLVLLLSLYNARKKVSTLPIGNNAVWLQFHIYAGFLSILVFFIHVDWRLPNGWLEGALAAVFGLVAASGVVGLVLSRMFPKWLARRGEEVIFERVPIHIARLREEAEKIVLQATEETNSSTISGFYVRLLAPFFARPRNILQHLQRSNRALHRLEADLDNLKRYLNARENEHLEELRWLVTKKDEVDFHYALQGALKTWLFVHVPLTYCLIVLACVHLVLAYAFSGGVG